MPRALMAPHLDPRRAGPAMARAYLELDPETAAREPLRVVVFGTGHSLFGDLFALTRKHFDTPLGRVACDVAFVDALAERLGPRAYHSEIVHRDEHSIEFQAIYLKHRFGESKLSIVPILCGGFHQLLDEGKTPRDSAEFEALIGAVRDTEQKLGGRTVYVAGVDFSHVGPRFGDPAVDDPMREEIATKDHQSIEAARRGDADGWFQSIAAHGDSTRVCGFAPTYALLRCAEPGEGRLLRYDRSDEKDSSFVTIASMVW
jgi:AmmeMemoRadiSam system protein B